MRKQPKNERHRILRILRKGKNTLPLPINNQEIHLMAMDGLITISAPRQHRHYQVVELSLTDGGYDALKRLEPKP